MDNRVMLDAVQVLSGVVANGCADRSSARKAALALATQAGIGDQMHAFLKRVDQTAEHQAAQQRSACQIVDQVAALVTEFREAGRNKHADTHVAAAFFSCGERLAEVLRGEFSTNQNFRTE